VRAPTAASTLSRTSSRVTPGKGIGTVLTTAPRRRATTSIALRQAL
jgi:hypothetical protein